MSDSDKDEYKVPAYESYGNYWWDYPGGEGGDSPNAGMLQDDNYPRTIEKEPVTPAPEMKKEESEDDKITYHNDFHEHGPSGNNNNNNNNNDNDNNNNNNNNNNFSLSCNHVAF